MIFRKNLTIVFALTAVTKRIIQKLIVVVVFLLVSVGIKGQSVGTSNSNLKIEVIPNTSSSIAHTIDQLEAVLESIAELGNQLGMLYEELKSIQTQLKSTDSEAGKEEMQLKMKSLLEKIQKLKSQIQKKEELVPVLQAKLVQLQAQEQKEINKKLDVVRSDLVISHEKGGTALKAVMILPNAAPKNGIIVKLKSSNRLVSVPEEIRIRAGRTSQEFTIHTRSAASTSSIRIDVEIINNQKPHRQHFDIILQGRTTR